MARTSVRVWFGVAGALALAGIADTAYLLVLAGASEAGAQCAVGGCAGVLNSPYAYTLGVSNAVWGLLAYAVVFALTALGLAGPAALRRGVPALVMVVAYVGVAAHAYFVYVQAAILREFCPFCLTSAGLMLVLAAVATIIGSWTYGVPPPDA